MISAFSTGFFLGISLIIAIGAQNIFVLKQGIIGKHVFYVALFCALSDALLISIGVAGTAFYLNNLAPKMSNLLFGFSAIWLFGYGTLRLIAAFKSNTSLEIEVSSSKGLLSTLWIVAIFTFANPHVYLDTMVLIGSASHQFLGENKISFAVGAYFASFIFFFSLAYGAKLLKPIMKHPSNWRLLDGLISIIMFILAIKLANAGNWL